MPSAFTPKQWIHFVDSLPETTDLIPGYLNAAQFAERSQSTQQYIKEALVNGTLNRAHCVKYRRGTYHTVLINWNKAGYDFVLRRPQHRWPADFRRNKERSYRPIPVGDIDPTPFLARPSPMVTNTEMYRDDVADEALSTLTPDAIDAIGDIGHAKLVGEKLKLKKLALETKMIEGTLMTIDEVIAANRDICFQLRAKIIATINRLAPEVAAESGPGACRLLMVQAFNEAFEMLRGLNRGTSEEDISIS